MAATTFTTRQYEYWYTVIKQVMTAAGFTFTANQVSSVTQYLYMTKDVTVADNYVTIIQYHLNLSLLQTSAIAVTSTDDKIKITITTATVDALMVTRNGSYV